VGGFDNNAKGADWITDLDDGRDKGSKAEGKIILNSPDRVQIFDK
jgi:hypothetical protein